MHQKKLGIFAEQTAYQREIYLNYRCFLGNGPFHLAFYEGVSLHNRSMDSKRWNERFADVAEDHYRAPQAVEKYGRDTNQLGMPVFIRLNSSTLRSCFLRSS